MTDYGPRHAARTRTADQVRAAADRAEGVASPGDLVPAAAGISERGGTYSITTLAEIPP